MSRVWRRENRRISLERFPDKVTRPKKLHHHLVPLFWFAPTDYISLRHHQAAAARVEADRAAAEAALAAEATRAAYEHARSLSENSGAAE